MQVQEIETSPTEIINGNFSYLGYSGGAYAGVVNLKVDGVAADGFCIDPFHFSNPSSVTATYDVVNLKDAPKPPGPMGAGAALEIEKLWGYVYSLSPSISAENAAGLQIAIWEVVVAASTAPGSFSLNDPTDYGAANFRSIVESPSYGGPIANLVGLKSQSSSGQDYVVQGAGDLTTLGVPGVPDGGTTLGLLGVGSLSLILARKWRGISGVS